MGLLDDAIREHMELKRRRGADPSLVARQEQDALGPARHEEGIESSVFEDGAVDSEALAVDETAPGGNGSSDLFQPARGLDFASVVGQETAELDMRTVLADGHDDQEAPAATRDTADIGDPLEGMLEEAPNLLRDPPDQESLWLEQSSSDLDYDE